MDNNVLDMMEKFDEKVKRAAELRKVSNPEITENGENNIQELTSEQLRLKMKIERVQEGLEEYKKEDDYLGKSEYQRKIAEKEYTDRIEELKNEESKSVDNLKKAKEELEKQRSIEDEEKSIKEEIKKFGTAENIRMVKDAIVDVENQIDQAQLDFKSESSKISIQMEEKNMKISQLEKARQRLNKEPSWDQTKYDEYTKEIDSLKNELGLLEQMQQQNENKRDTKIEELVGKKTKFENFAKRLEYIFYGKDILNEEEKEENNQTKTEKENESTNSEESKQTKTEETKQAEQPATSTKSTSERTGVAEQPTTTVENLNEETKKPEIIISAKQDRILVNGKEIDNLGIAKAYEDKKELFKKLKMNKQIKGVMGKSFFLKRIFINPIIVARIKSKMDPTIVELIERQENEDGTKIGEKIGLSLADYIKSVRTKEELPVDLTYDLKGSKFDNEELMSVENQMQRYAGYANQITGVQVDGLKRKRSLFERLSAGLKTSGLIEEQTMADKMEKEYQSTGRDIDEEEKISFRDEMKVNVNDRSEKIVEPNKDSIDKKEKNAKQENEEKNSSKEEKKALKDEQQEKTQQEER